ncbi:chaperonin GroEL, partial [Methanosalsum natronophilum]
IEIKRGIDKATAHIVSQLKAKSEDVDDRNKIVQVATISANNDQEIGNLIADAMEKVGYNGVITVEESNNIDTGLELVEGMQFDRGYLSPYMATDHEKMLCELENPYVLVTDKKINSLNQIVPVLEMIANNDKGLLIISPDVEGDAQAALILNIMRASLKVCAVKAPGFGDEQKEMLEDIAAVTGATVITEDKGMKLEEFSEDMLGTARKINVDKQSTTIVEGYGKKEDIDQRVKILEAQIESEDSDYRKKELRKRLAKLGGGVAVIKVGAATETELKEKKMRTDDALNATKAAVEEGVVTGGGVTLFRFAMDLDKLNLEDDQQIGLEIIKKALTEPVRQIGENAGREGAEIVAALKNETNEHYGYNAKKDIFENLFDAGVIDPAKVVRSSLQNAASIAGMVLITEALVADYEVEKDDKSPAIII